MCYSIVIIVITGALYTAVGPEAASAPPVHSLAICSHSKSRMRLAFPDRKKGLVIIQMRSRLSLVPWPVRGKVFFFTRHFRFGGYSCQQCKQNHSYLAEQKTTKTKPKHNGPSQITPSKEGASEGLRLIHAVALPLQRDIAIFWKR